MKFDSKKTASYIKRHIAPPGSFREQALEPKSTRTLSGELARSIIVAGLLVAVCALCLVGGSWAWFTGTTTTGVMTVQSSGYTITATVKKTSDSSVVGTVTLPSDTSTIQLADNTNYTVTLTATGTASYCYCTVKLPVTSTELYAPLRATTEGTTRCFKVNTGTLGTTNSLTFTSYYGQESSTTAASGKTEITGSVDSPAPDVNPSSILITGTEDDLLQTAADDSKVQTFSCSYIEVASAQELYDALNPEDASEVSHCVKIVLTEDIEDCAILTEKEKEAQKTNAASDVVVAGQTGSALQFATDTDDEEEDADPVEEPVVEPEDTQEDEGAIEDEEEETSTKTDTISNAQEVEDLNPYFTEEDTEVALSRSFGTIQSDDTIIFDLNGHFITAGMVDTWKSTKNEGNADTAFRALFVNKGNLTVLDSSAQGENAGKGAITVQALTKEAAEVDENLKEEIGLEIETEGVSWQFTVDEDTPLETYVTTIFQNEGLLYLKGGTYTNSLNISEATEEDQAEDSSVEEDEEEPQTAGAYIVNNDSSDSDAKCAIAGYKAADSVYNSAKLQSENGDAIHLCQGETTEEETYANVVASYTGTSISAKNCFYQEQTDEGVGASETIVISGGVYLAQESCFKLDLSGTAGSVVKDDVTSAYEANAQIKITGGYFESNTDSEDDNAASMFTVSKVYSYDKEDAAEVGKYCDVTVENYDASLDTKTNGKAVFETNDVTTWRTQPSEAEDGSSLPSIGKFSYVSITGLTSLNK